MKFFFPFDYKDKSKEDYYSIYNAIKHDRVKNINKATIYALIRALGALYLLNVYFKNERLLLKDDYYGTHIDKSFGSDIFSVEVALCKDYVILSSEMDIIPEQCVYRIIREESKHAFLLSYRNQFGEAESVSLVSGNKEFQEYAAACVNNGITEDQFWEFTAASFNMTAEQFKLRFFANHKVSEFLSVRAYKMKAVFWAELNK